MKTLSTEQIVAKIADSYRRAGKAMAKAERRNGPLSSWMNEDTFEKNAQDIENAFNEGKIEKVSREEYDKIMDQYAAPDEMHLVASYFNNTGKILSVA